MGMRLLSKKDINQANSVARTQEINEGKKLAKRIDGLRETLLNEEASLEKFRCETVAAIQAEITPLEEQKGLLEKDVRELTQKRIELRKPLTAEWETVEKAKDDIKKQQEDLEKQRAIVDVDKKEAKKERKEAERAKRNALTCEETAQEKLKGAIIKEREANELQDQAQKTKEAAVALERETLANIAEEKRKLALREEALVVNEKAVAEQQEANLKERKLLIDERATLERAFNRLKPK